MEDLITVLALGIVALLMVAWAIGAVLGAYVAYQEYKALSEEQAMQRREKLSRALDASMKSLEEYQRDDDVDRPVRH